MSSGIPASGALDASDLNTETGKASNSKWDMDSAVSRELASKPKSKSTIKFSDYRSKIWRFDLSISGNSTTTYDVRAKAVAAGWNQQSRLYVTVKKGVTMSGNPAMKVAGSFPNGVYLTIEKGASVLGNGGRGGDGSYGAHDSGPIDGKAGNAGCPAIRLGNTKGQTAFDCEIYCDGVVAGGGGGGGGGAANHRKHHGGTGGCGGGGGVPYGGGGLGKVDYHYNAWGDDGTAATRTEPGIGGNHGNARGGGNGALAGQEGERGMEGQVGKQYAVGIPGVGGAAGAYISGGRYARIMRGTVGSNFIGSYVY